METVQRWFSVADRGQKPIQEDWSVDILSDLIFVDACA